MAASGAKYGMMTSHFYWVGAIPAMVFVGIFMMPFYYGSRARSVPEYLKLRFDEKTRGFNAMSFAVMTVFSSGISMYALARVARTHAGLELSISASLVSAIIVLVYIFLGGLTSAIYNEVLQFFLIVLGFAAAGHSWAEGRGRLGGLKAKLSPGRDQRTVSPPGTGPHSWRHMGSAPANPMGVDGSAWSWAWASCFRSVIGARIFW